MTTSMRFAAANEQRGDLPRFAAKSEFWTELKAAVREHLASEAKQGRPTVGDPRVRRNAFVVILWFVISYSALLFAVNLGAAVIAAFSLAFAASAVGFAVFHDANHRTLCRTPAANLFAARLCSVLLGPSRHFWVHKHHSLHHRQPNVFGWDDDLETRGLLRLSPVCTWMPRFQRQELKAVLYYGLNTMEWVFWKDFRCLVSGRLSQSHPLELTRNARVEFLVSKGLYLLIFVLPPFVFLPLAWASAAFILFHLTFSWVLAAVFQIAHLTPAMEFGGVRPDDDWAKHQIRTTGNFATNSRIATWFTGGLNHQIEHHLFPNVAHTHYSALRPIVCATAERHGLECLDLGSFGSALREHFALLKTLGQHELNNRDTSRL